MIYDTLWTESSHHIGLNKTVISFLSKIEISGFGTKLLNLQRNICTPYLAEDQQPNPDFFEMAPDCKMSVGPLNVTHGLSASHLVIGLNPLHLLQV